MTKEELIEEAKRRYPHGTKFRSAGGGGGPYIVDTIKNKEVHTFYGNSENIDGGFGCGYLYYEGKWAEIISSPKVKEIELIEGNWYEGNYCERHYIFHFLKEIGECFHVDKEIRNGNQTSTGNWEGYAGRKKWKDLKLADLEEVYKYFPEERPKTVELTSFPSEGKCESLDDKLVDYITSRPNTSFTPGGPGKDRAKGVAWNSNSYWFFVESSGKTEYTLSQLEKFLPKSSEFVLPDKWVIKLKSQEEFDTFLEWWFTKCPHDRRIHIGSLIVGKEYYCAWKGDTGGYNSTNTYSFPLITFEQFQKYVLKSTLEVKKEETVKFEVGKWYKLKAFNSASHYYAKVQKLTSEGFVSDYFISSGSHYTGGAFQNISESSLLTDLTEIQQFLPEGHVDKIKKEELSQYWKISHNRYNHNFINKYTELIPKNKSGDLIGYIDLNSSNYHKGSSADSNGTFILPSKEEIEWLERCISAGKFIPKEEALKPVSSIPEYVECEKNKGQGREYFNVGKIYKTISEKGNNLHLLDHSNIERIVYYGLNHPTRTSDATYFKPSTKELFDAQFKAKEPVMKENLVGRWFKALEDNINSSLTKRNEYYQITKNHGDNISFTSQHVPNMSLKITNPKIELMPIGFVPEQEKSKIMNTYGLNSGDHLSATILNTWGLSAKNAYYADSRKIWEKVDCFRGDREIKGFKDFDGIIGFLVSGTGNVYMKAEGFKEFRDNFDKPTPMKEEDWIKEAKNRYSVYPLTPDQCYTVGVDPYERKEASISVKIDAEVSTLHIPNSAFVTLKNSENEVKINIQQKKSVQLS